MTKSSTRHYATVVLSAGRCGTQWLAKTLRQHYGGLAEIQHEPMAYKYYPRNLLRSNAPFEDHPEWEEIREHLIRIKVTLRDRDYVETGWPAFAAVPLFQWALGEQTRIVHLARHPVYSACSMVTHEYYQSGREDGYTRHALLQPSDAGTILKGYSERWDRMSPYEKCLFHWAEINAYGLELRRSLERAVPWMQIRMEEVFDPESGLFAELLGFLGLPAAREPLEAVRARFDQYRTRTRMKIEWQEIRNHPAILRVASALGYDPDAVSPERLEGRYHGT